MIIRSKLQFFSYIAGFLSLLITSFMYSCTGVRIIAQNGAIVYGRTLEFGKDIESNIVIIPRNYSFTGTVPTEEQKGLSWKSKYAVVGANAFDVIQAIDGVNEKGLAGGLFYFSDYAGYQDVTEANYQNSIAPWELMTWILTNFSTVEEVREALPSIRISNTRFAPLGIVPPLHAIVHDATGESLVIEYVQGKLFLYDNKIGVITNAPTFDWHKTNLKNYIRLSARNVSNLQLQNLNLTPLGQGSGMLGLPGDFTSTSRFVRAVAFSQSVLSAKNEDEARSTIFHILNIFDIPRGVVYEQEQGQTVYDYTQWTSASDLRNSRYYFTTYDNSQQQMVDLMAMDLDAPEAKMVSMNNRQIISDVTPKNSGAACRIVEVSQKDLFESGVQAYIYGYPLVLMEITKKIMTHGSPSYKSMMRPQASINEFAHVPVFPTDAFTAIVRPNVDTLYSFAWLDLSGEPLILSVPNTYARYYLLEIMDAWTNVFSSIGKRTTGTKAQNFVLIGPSWKGELPKKMTVIQSPTAMALLLGRTQTNGKDDYDAVHAIQAGYTLTPLSTWQKKAVCLRQVDDTAFDETFDIKTAPVDQVAALNAQEFFTLFAQALKNNPMARRDYAMIEKLRNIGIEPGQDFDGNRLSSEMMDTLGKSIAQAKRAITDKAQNIGKMVNGWNVLLDEVGTYGVDYLTRAIIAYIGIGANLPQDAVYPTAFVDADGKVLRGKHNYLLHFDKNSLPPVNAFWSVTLYNSKSFLVPNSIGRYALGDRDILSYNKDGSLDIYIQHESPKGNKETNWLPAPEGDFNLTLRMYWPKPTVLKGIWNPPALKRVD